MSNANKRDAPCRHCEERHVFCHTTCDKYAKWKDEHDKKLDRLSIKELLCNKLHLLLSISKPKDERSIKSNGG